MSVPNPVRVPALSWEGDHIEIIDQTLLPERLETRELRSVADVVSAIRTLAVRGAPLLGVCGAFGVVLGLQEPDAAGEDEAHRGLTATVTALEAARPTAANLAWAVRRAGSAAAQGIATGEMRRLALEEAMRIQECDIESSRRIGEAGSSELAGVPRLLTICNTGRLVSAGTGTALGIVYAKAAAGERVEVVACETRPLLQGARLTAWELEEAGIPVTLIADGAAAAALAAGLVDAVVVGCDRVARNGDTANKIGTYGLALLALAHDVPFYVAGPMTSFDPVAAGGEGIVIEERSGDELRRAGGARVAPDVPVWNPAFDVTPGELVTAFITDAGILRPPYEESIPRGLAEADRLGLRDP